MKKILFALLLFSAVANAQTKITLSLGAGGGSGGGTGTANTNVGSGYRILKPSTEELKTLFAAYGILIDSSSNTNGLTFKIDTTLLTTIAGRNKLADSLAIVLQQSISFARSTGNNVPGYYYRGSDTTFVIKDWVGETYIITDTKTDSTGRNRIDTAALRTWITTFAAGAPNYAWTTITDGATLTFDAASYINATTTLGGNRTIAFSNLSSAVGKTLTYELVQDGTGGRTITLPGICVVVNGGGGAITLTTTPGARDILQFVVKTTSLVYVTYGPNFN